MIWLYQQVMQSLILLHIGILYPKPMSLYITQGSVNKTTTTSIIITITIDALKFVYIYIWPNTPKLSWNLLDAACIKEITA